MPLNYIGDWVEGDLVLHDGFVIPQKKLWDFVTRFTYMTMLANIPGPSGRSITIDKGKLPVGLALGCDWGHCWAVFENCFEEVYGLEIEEWAVQQGRDLGHRIYPGTIDDIPFNNDFFDVVCSRHVLPHGCDVDAILSGIMRVTKPGGWSAHCIVCTRDDVSPIPGLIQLYKIHLSYSDWKAKFVEHGFEVVTDYFGWATNMEDWVIIARKPEGL